MKTSRFAALPGCAARPGAMALCGLVAALAALLASDCAARAEEVLPKHITPATLKAVRAGLDFLAKSQDADGSWINDEGGRSYPVAVTGLAGTALLANGNTSTRGRYAPQVEKATEYLLSCSTSSGLITGPSQDNGQPMHGHGFALMFLACVYGTETKPTLRDKTKEAIDKAVKLTRRGPEPRPAAGPTFPAVGDEGSVTVTQVQASARGAQRRVGRAARHDRPGGRNTSNAAAPPKAASATRSANRRRRSAGDFGRGRGHALQRRTVRRAGGQPLPGIRVAAISRTPKPGSTAATTFIASCMPRRPFTWPATNTGTTIFPVIRDQLISMQRQGRRLLAGRRHRQGLRHGHRPDHPAIALQVPARLSTLSKTSIVPLQSSKRREQPWRAHPKPIWPA